MKRFIALFLVFSVLALSVPLAAKERKGADLIIQRTDGTQVRGELIAVKESSLLLLDRDTGSDVSVDIGDIGVITIVRKSKALLGAGLGFIVFAGVGALIGHNEKKATDPDVSSAIYGSIYGGIGLIIGGLVGFSKGEDKTIRIGRRPESQIKEILNKLQKKARIKNAL